MSITVRLKIILTSAMLIMLLCKGSSLPVMYGCGFISIIKSSARVESLGTALASTTLQAKPAWARGKAKQFLNVYS